TERPSAGKLRKNEFTLKDTLHDDEFKKLFFSSIQRFEASDHATTTLGFWATICVTGIRCEVALLRSRQTGSITAGPSGPSV
uniref:Uncharacterized protein n=1 Tax=Anopheles atroparvus TaxID=41427 RepID=A0AAG5D214_ANOAO